MLKRLQTRNKHLKLDGAQDSVESASQISGDILEIPSVVGLCDIRHWLEASS